LDRVTADKDGLDPFIRRRYTTRDSGRGANARVQYGYPTIHAGDEDPIAEDQ
jgi:hypothetical protein